jgi:parvulin-like peptidyl-prolyl isomerase
MEIIANVQDPNIAITTIQSTDELDTPLARLSNKAMSGEEVIGILQRYWLLPQLQRELIIDAALATVECSAEEIFSAYKAFYHQYQISSDLDRAIWLERNQFTLGQLEDLVLRTIKIDRFKQITFGGKVNSYFLQSKSKLDRALYSLLRVKDPEVAQELFFRIQAGEATFTELAQQYSGGKEAEIGGLIGPHDMSMPHPILAQKLLSMRSGELAAPIQIAEWFVIVRLEQYLPAQLDAAMRTRLTDELYEQWIQSQLNQLVG